LQAFYSVRSERQLMEQIEYNLLYRWFVGLGVDDPVWDHSTFSKNRDRLLDADVAAKFLDAVLRHPKVKRLLSDEHFSVDGTLIEAWASMNPGRNGEKDFRGERRKNETHASITDPDAKLFRKGQGREARLCFMGHALMENRNGLVVQAHLTEASGTAERRAAFHMIERQSPGSTRRLTLGADKGYDAAAFITELRRMCVTPHIARNDAVTKTGKRRRTEIDARTTRHPGYAVSQRVRKRIEEAFGWAKTIAGLAKVKHRGTRRVGFRFTFAMAAYNLVRLPRLLVESG
jgi:IS5 family transposase